MNFINKRDGHERDAYRENYDRPVALKDESDTEKQFRLNQNLTPSFSPKSANRDD